MSDELFKEEMSEIHQISTKIAVLSEQLKILVQQMTEMKSDIKEIKEIQSEKISVLEREVALLKDKVERMEWTNKIITGLTITSILGGVLSLIFKN